MDIVLYPRFRQDDAAASRIGCSPFRRIWYDSISPIPRNANGGDLYIALSQSAAAYTDPDNGINFVGTTDAVHQITYGYVFPPVSSTTTPNEFIGEIVAPIANKWAGVSPGGGMIKQLLLVAWPNGNAIVRSARYATYDLFCI